MPDGRFGREQVREGAEMCKSGLLSLKREMIRGDETYTCQMMTVQSLSLDAVELPRGRQPFGLVW